MSFFELDGGKAKKAKPKAKKSTKPKAPAKKTSGKKKTKKGGNFLGTVSELFAPAGWENFVTAAGLLALDRTDNYLRKSKDSKKQRGGEEVKMEEMDGGARKRSSSRKQRGGSDGHHTVEALDAMMGSEEPEMTSQTGGAKKKKGKGRKQCGGEFISDDKKQQFLELYNRTNNERPNNNKSQNSDRRIKAILEEVGASINPNAIGEMDAAITEAKQLIKNRTNAQRVAANNSAQVAVNNGQLAANAQRVANNGANAQRVANMGQQAQAQAQEGNQSLFSGIGFGGKKAPKKKTGSKKPKAKKSAPKRK